MWNVPLTHDIALSVATGCALFLFGLSIGLVLAGVCWAFIAASDTCRTHPTPTSSATISDEEIEIVIELVRDALAADGWTLCGDCYGRQLLQQMQFPVQEWEFGIPSSSPSPRKPCSTRRVDAGRHIAQHTPDPEKNQREPGLRVEQGEYLGRVTVLSSSSKERDSY